jgi:site-specific recombinase XerD
MSAVNASSRPVADAAPGSLAGLIPSWTLSLHAGRKSPKTVRTYLDAAEQLLAFLETAGMPTDVDSIRREHVEAFIVHLIDTRSASTAATRFRALQQLFKWLEDEGEIAASPMARMRPPKLDEPLVPHLGDAEMSALVAACGGKDFDDRRDMAIVRLMLDTGMRRAECAALAVADLDFGLRVAHVVGKGRRARACPFGTKTAAALDRYLRARRSHRFATSPELWLGVRGPMTDSGLAQVLRRRGNQAGIEKLHPHQLRHTFAHQFLSEGGSEGDLMRLGGWRSRQMLDRYGKSGADQRAREAYDRFGLGDRI